MSEAKEMLEGIIGKKIKKSEPRPDQEIKISSGEENKNESNDNGKS